MCVRTIVICLFVIVIVDCFSHVTSLDPNGEGVCVVKLSSRQKRRKSFAAPTTKWCGRKKCVVRRYKTESYLTWTNHTVCCNGWQHDSNLDACLPICSTGCLGGSCIGPDQCQCTPPTYLDPELLNTCVTPTCSPTCVNADCQANNTCICKPNYTGLNSTHCFNCPDGYAPDDTFNCSPVCDEPCMNSTCTAPNTCSCLDGHRPITETICEPICDCVNSICIAPKTCSCFEGYQPVNETYCEPECQGCDNGKCVAPKKCLCDAGYKKVDGHCQPKCSEPCVNGFCSAPDVCSCDDGFKEDKTGVCVESCNASCKGYCDGGKCVQWNCSKPIPKSPRRRPPAKYKKVPVCCIGWDIDPSGDSCSPLCVSGCDNGTCVDVDVCHCEPPLELVKHACVMPTCTPPCHNAHCVASNTCQCDEGYLPYNETLCIPHCESGYFNDPIECKPKCDKPCEHGVCSGPNTCSCDDGYTNQDNETCIPKCEHCQHGNCIAPNDCRCHKGYSKRNGVCEPNCDSVCANGICAEPNKCKCYSGYELDADNKFNCLPICEPKCVHASCVSPNKCSCLLGYESTGNASTCRPKCDDCEFGRCVLPYNCSCFDGYERIRRGERESCEPICSQQCINGYCSKPEECTCAHGYMKNETNSNVCFKPCLGPCSNGTCDLNGTCICDRGFEYQTPNNDTCIAMKATDCNSCNYTEEEDGFWCEDDRPCFLPTIMPPEPTSLASLRLGWLLGGIAGLLLLVMVIIVIQRIWHKRKQFENKAPDSGVAFGSVVYTVPNTLTQPRISEGGEGRNDGYEEVSQLEDDNYETSDTLLRNGRVDYDERL